MCKCDPNKRTPFCGAPGCEWPPQTTTEGKPPAQMVVDTIKFYQDGDTWKPNDVQELTIKQEDAGGPDGTYWVISTERWAVNSMDELIDLLRRAEKAKEVER